MADQYVDAKARIVPAVTDPAGTTPWHGPMVDAHQHFWGPLANHHPWLAPDAMIPFRYGNYSEIKPRYLPDDHRRDAIVAQASGSTATTSPPCSPLRRPSRWSAACATDPAGRRCPVREER